MEQSWNEAWSRDAHHGYKDWHLQTSAGVLILVLALVLGSVLLRWQQKQELRPPSVWDPIPHVFNTVQFLLDNHAFMKRVLKTMGDNVNLVNFHLGTTQVYLARGPRNTQTIFSHHMARKIGNEEIMVQRVFPILYKMSPGEVQRFAQDASGRKPTPLPGLRASDHDDEQQQQQQQHPQRRRYWLDYEHVHKSFLARPQHLQPLSRLFAQYFAESLDEQQDESQSRGGGGGGGGVGSWRLESLCRGTIAKCAIATLLGPRVFDLNQGAGNGFLDAFWRFDAHVFQLALGLPRWMSPGPYRAQDAYLAMITRYLDAAWAAFDWESPTACEAPWEPCFGARISREIVAWLRQADFRDEVAAGALGTLLFAQNSNTIPTMMWVLAELARDTQLQRSIRAEVATAREGAEEETGAGFDVQKLVKLPLLQSVFTEILRLHMHFNLIRHVREEGVSMEYDAVVSSWRASQGSRFCAIPRNAMLQAPMMVAHYDEAVWGKPGHPASEFWAERHVKWVKSDGEEEEDGGRGLKKKRIFSMAGRPNSFFPFGGGETICPGRHLAKQEVFMVVAHLVSRYTFECEAWVHRDGSRSDREGQNDKSFYGAGAMPPDRDMIISWARI